MVPERVAEHYLCLTINELLEDVLRHYRTNVWPKIEEVVASHLNDTSTTGIVLEGSALLPELVMNLDIDSIVAVWLTASEEVFRQRIQDESLYRWKSPREQLMIDKFLERTLAYNALLVDAVNQQGLTLVDVLQSNVTELIEGRLSSVRKERQVRFSSGGKHEQLREIAAQTGGGRDDLDGRRYGHGDREAGPD